MLTIDSLHARIDSEGEDRPILNGVSLTVPKGETHAVMGPNGCGKSTLSYVLAGREGYEITAGRVLFEGEDVTEAAPEDRAAKGLFLGFQYPVEIHGVPTLTFLKEALNAQRRARGEADIPAPVFMKRARERAQALSISNDMLKRPVNVGFSGGEKKRMEIFQAAMLEPRFLILDEADSGLDIDALKTVAEGINALCAPERGLLIITHYQRLLDYVRPDKVHVMAQGRIAETGGPELAERLEAEGYDRYGEKAA